MRTFGAPMRAMSKPARGGPMTPLEVKLSISSAFAVASRSSGTRLGTMVALPAQLHYGTIGVSGMAYSREDDRAMDGMRRFDRLFGIVLLLRGGHAVSAAEIARRFGVSRRTVHRDMDSLSALGIPVYAERG